MPQSAHELQALESTGGALHDLLGGDWVLSPDVPDDEYPNEPSPDGILVDGGRTAAVEIKRLTGDSTWNDYVAARRSLRRWLAPPSGGYWHLIPRIDFHLPMDLRTRRRVRKGIAAQQELRPGESGSIRLPRTAVLELTRPDGEGHVFCGHTMTGRAEFADAASRLTAGTFFLRDDEQHEHKFVTDTCREEFFEALRRGALDLLAGAHHVEIEWDEEWELLRDRDEDPGSVQIVAITPVRDVFAANKEAVSLVLDDALAKFESRRWGDLHVVALVRGGVMLEPEYLAEVIQSYPADDFADVDVILILDGEVVVLAWQRQ